MRMATSTQLPIPPENLYAAFCGEINDGSVKRIVANLTGATFNNQNVHLLFQSSGGCVGDGVCLYNFFRSLPIELTIYNVGSVYSAGVLAYLGGKRRVTSKRAMFMVHRVMTNPGRTPAMAMKGIAKSLILEDERVESICEKVSPSRQTKNGLTWTSMTFSFLERKRWILVLRMKLESTRLQRTLAFGISLTFPQPPKKLMLLIDD